MSHLYKRRTFSAGENWFSKKRSTRRSSEFVKNWTFRVLELALVAEATVSNWLSDFQQVEQQNRLQLMKFTRELAKAAREAAQRKETITTGEKRS